MCVWDHCPVGTPNCTQEPIFWRMILDFPEEFGDNPAFFRAAEMESNQLHGVILLAPCWAASPVFFELKVSPSLLQTYCCSFWPKNSALFHLGHKIYNRFWFEANFMNVLWQFVFLSFHHRKMRAGEIIQVYVNICPWPPVGIGNTNRNATNTVSACT